MTKISGVIFDKDGTLFDFSRTWEAWAASFLNRIARDAAQAVVMGRSVGYDVERQKFEENSIVIAGTPLEVATALTKHLPHHSMDELLNVINEEAAAAPQAEVVPLRAYVNDLRQAGYQLGVVTNDAEEPARSHLDAAGATDFFDFIAGSDSGWGAKPEPGQLLACAQAMGLDPAQTVMVGDSTHDLIAASRAGMRGIAVLTGMADAQTLAPHAHVVLPDIGHLPAWLNTQNSA